MATPDQDRRGFHPAVSISSWLIFALAVEFASPMQLLIGSLPVSLLLLGRNAVGQFFRLLWKARWLWLALMVMYGWSLPGSLVFSSLYSPTLEGLQAGGLRITRLVLLLASLAWLLTEFSARELAAGIYLLARPIACLGLDRRALAVRLALTLEQLESRQQAGNWLQQLKLSPEPGVATEEIRLSLPLAGPHDTLLLVAALAMLGVVLS